MVSGLSRVIDALPGLVWTVSLDGAVTFTNKSWAEYTGQAAGQMFGESWLRIVHAEDRPGLQARWQAICAAGEGGEMEGRLRRFDGQFRIFLIQFRPIAEETGTVRGWCGIATDIGERVQAERKLRESESRFRLAVDGLPVMVTLHAPDGQSVYANRFALDFAQSDLPGVQVRPQGWSFHPDDRERFLARWKQALETGECYEFEGRRLRADGSVRWMQTIGYPLRDSSGEIAVWYLIHNDINDKRIAEARIAAEMKLLGMIATGASLFEVLDTLCCSFEEISPDCTCSVALVNGDRLHDAASPSLPSEFTKAINGRSISRENGPCAMAACLNQQIISADITKETRWHTFGWPELALSFGLKACWSTPIVAPSGSVSGTLGLHFHEPAQPTALQLEVIAQFTHLASIAIERAHKEDALRRNQAFLAEAQRISAIGSFTWNMETNEISWSDETYRIYQVEPGTRVTLDLIKSRHPSDGRWLLNDIWEKAIRGEKLGSERRLILPDGTVRYVHLVAQLRRNRDGQREYIGACQDITARRTAEEALDKVRSELARVSRVMSLGALTASIAHEVNQPLSGIVTNAATGLRMLSADPPDVRGALETARRTIRDANRASDVIARLRGLFTGKGMATEALDLGSAAREVIELSRNQLLRAKIDLQQDYAADLPLVLGDKVQLQQVIMNLMMNAVDALSEVQGRSRRISVSTSVDDAGSVCFTVSDNGIGFDIGIAERLFDAFYTTKSEGMGIGLAVSRLIVESHKGRIWARNSGEGGAAFSFSVPAASHQIVEGTLATGNSEYALRSS